MQKTGKTLFILLLFAHMTVQVHHETRDQVETQVNTNGNPFSYVVPNDQLAEAKEYGFSFWVRPSYLKPILFKSETFIQYDLGIAGIHENTDGYCEDSGRYGGALNIFLQRGEWSNVPTYYFQSYNQLDPNDEQRSIEFSRVEFDNEWNFVYMAYSYVESKAYAYTYFAKSDSTQSVEWLNSQKRQSIPTLKFRLGGCDPNTQATMQGYFKNVQFFYGETGSCFLGDKAHVDQMRNSQNLNFLALERPATEEVVEPVIDQDPKTFHANDNNGQQNVFENLNGPEEYAVWGWAKWTEPSERSPAHLLFRLTTDEPGELQDEDKIGDRTLACFIEPGTLGFSTYTFAFDMQQVMTNFYQYEDYQNQIGDWFFVYFGYSNTQNQAYAYTRFPRGEVQLIWDNVYHMLPNKVVLQLGKDDFHRGFSGEMKNWNFGYGPGTYRNDQSQFEGLYTQSETTTTTTTATSTEWATLSATLADGSVDTSISVSLQELGQVVAYESNYRQVEPVYKFDVPAEELIDVKDVSFSFWFKWSFQYPDYTSIAELQTNLMSLAQVSEINRHGSAPGDRVLSAWLKPLLFGQKTYFLSTYAINRSIGNWGQDVDIRNQDDFDSAWTWLYFAYTPTTDALYSYMRFASGEVVTLAWESATHNYPPEGLHFSIGKAQNEQYSFNGLIYNVQFNYKGESYVQTREQVEDYYFNRVTKPNMNAPAYTDNTVLSAETQFVQGLLGEQNAYYSQDNAAADSLQYSAYGWFKWNAAGTIQSQHALFRLTTLSDQEQSDNDKPGDRTLAYYISEGVIVANTYSYSFTSEEFRLKNSIPYEDDLESWFWVYFGYDYASKKAFTFVRFYDRIISHTFNGAMHQVPNKFKFTFGNDKYLNSFNGKIKDVHFAFGAGAYQDTGLDRLYEAEAPLNQPLLEADNFWTKEPLLININAEEESELTIVVPEKELAQLTQYSFSFWWRFSFQDPQRVAISQVREKWVDIARILEKSAFYGAEGGKSLSVSLLPLHTSNQPTLQFTTYAENRQNDNDFQDMAFSMDQFDSEWNWMYFGYDIDLQRAYAAAVFGNVESKSLGWEQTFHQLPSQLKFQLGRERGDKSIGFNGQFFDVRFRYDNLAYKEAANVGTYLTSSISQPPNLTPMFSRVQLTDKVMVSTVNSVAKEIDFGSKFRGAREYSIYGWAKWVEQPQREPLHALFRLTTNSPSNQGNLEKSSDRTLACFVSETQLVFSTYTFGSHGGDNWNVEQSVDFRDDLNAWFFVYAGYDKTAQKAKVYVKFQDRYAELSFDSINHAVPKYIGTYVGKDQFYPGFQGELKGWIVSAGQGAYQETNYEQLMTYQEDVSDNRYYQSSTNVIFDQENPVSTLFDEDISSDMLQSMSVVTAWTWFQWNYKIPTSFGNPRDANGQCYYIMRLIKGSNEGQFTDLCFTSGGLPFLKFTEILDGQKQEQQVLLTSFDDLDGCWNFVYWSHNEETQTTMLYIYFSSSQTRQVYSFGKSKWNFPAEYIRLKLGGGVTSTNGRKLFNGRFFDCQVNTNVNYYGTTEDEIKFIQTLITQIPATFLDSAVDETAVRISFTLAEDGIVSTSDSTSTLIERQITGYTNIKKYAIYGWVRWQCQNSEKTKRVIYRVTQNQLSEARDATQPGDRSLTLFLTENNTLQLCTYNFEGDSSDYNLCNEVPFNVEGYLQKWMFIYNAYSYEQSRFYFYIRFNDGVEYEKQIEPIRHVQSGYYGMYLGKDWIYAPWCGQFFAWAFQVGGQSYVQTLQEVRTFITLATTTVVIPTEFDETITPTEGLVEEPVTDNVIVADYQESEEDLQSVQIDSVPTRTPNLVKEEGWLTTKDEDKAKIQGNYFINSWDGYSYFIDEFSIDQYYKLTITSGVPQGSRICFGYIPLEMAATLKELDSKNQKYNEVSIAVCSDNEINQCNEGTRTCTGGLFDTSVDATYMWAIGEFALVKQIVESGDRDCVFLNQTSEQYEFLGDDYCTYKKTVTDYLYRQNTKSITDQYTCQFDKKVTCLKDHSFEVEWVPYIELKGPIIVKINKDNFGEYDVINVDEQSCQNITNITTIQVSCPLLPRTCDDTFDQQFTSQEWYYATRGYSVDTQNLAQEGQYISEKNLNGNYYVTLKIDSPNSEVCFGYITSAQKEEYLLTPNDRYNSKTISVCTDGSKFTYGAQANCIGKMPSKAGTIFNVTVQLDFVQITDVQTRYFQCNFTRSSFRDTLIPWVSLRQPTTTVTVNISGIGQPEDLDCGYPYIDTPCRTCNDVSNLKDVNQQWYSAAFDYSISGPVISATKDGDQLISSQNQNANYEITLLTTDKYSTVCFGYVDNNLLYSKSLTTTKLTEQIIGVCTDRSKFSLQSTLPQIVDCQGVLNRTAGSSFTVSVQQNNVQITSSDKHYQCNLGFDNTIELVPWIQIGGAQAISVQQNGIGKADCPDADCSELYDPSPMTCQFMFDTSYLHDDLWQITPLLAVEGVFTTPSQYVSQNNVYANFEVTVEGDDTDICFGYVLQSDSDAAIAQTLDFAQTYSVCLDKSVSNLANSQCTGEIQNKAMSRFNLTVQIDSIQITSLDRYFQCNITATGPVVPWINLKKGEAAATLTGVGNKTCSIYPFYKRHCDPDFFDQKQVTEHVWFFRTDRVAQLEETLTNPTEGEYSQLISTPNINANYNITIEEDFTYGKEVCFGYIESSKLESITSKFNSQAAQTVSVCTSGNEFNSGSVTSQSDSPSKQCSGRLLDVAYSQWIVTVQLSSVQITQSDSHFQCNFPRNNVEVESLIPWIQIQSNQNVQAKLTAVGFLDCPYEYVPLSPVPPPPVPRTCKNDMFTTVTQDWVSITDASVKTSVLTNNGLHQYMQFVSENNNANYLITLNDKQGVVCFGFVDEEKKNTITAAPFQTNSISICTDDTKQNLGDEPFFCQGLFEVKAENQFNVTVLWNKVQITSLPEKYFQCNFTRSSSEEVLVPWVQIKGSRTEQPSVNVQQTGIGKIYNDGNSDDCGYGYNVPIPPPTPLYPQCRNVSAVTNNSWNDSLSDGSTDHQHYAAQQQFGNFKLTLTNDLEGETCFGAIPQANIVRALFNEESPANNFTQGLCISKNKGNFGVNYNPDKTRDFCWGLNNTKYTVGTSFNIVINTNKIQITQDDNRVHCEFFRDDNTLILNSWLYYTGKDKRIMSDDFNGLKPQITGVGNNDEPECNGQYEPYYPPQPWCNNMVIKTTWFDSISLNGDVQSYQLKLPLDWQSANNYLNFNVTLTEDVKNNYKLCFGVIPESSRYASFQEKDVSQNYSKGLCTNGQQMNYDKYVLPDKSNDFCRGLENLNKSQGNTFQILIKPDWVWITQDDNRFDCWFSRKNKTELVLPWIYYKGTAGSDVDDFYGVKILTFTQNSNEAKCSKLPPDVIVPPNPPPLCTRESMVDQSSIKSTNWQSNGQENTPDQISFDGVNGGFQEWTSLGNFNRNFQVKLESNLNAVLRKNVCFGFVKKSSVQGSLDQQDSSVNTISLCTNGNTNNYAQGVVECTNKPLQQKALSVGTIYQVDLLADKVQIYTFPSQSTYTLCTLTFRTDLTQGVEEFIPWIQISGSVGVTKVLPTLLGKGFINDPNNVCPVTVAQFVPPTCVNDFYQVDRVKDQNWMSTPLGDDVANWATLSASLTDLQSAGVIVQQSTITCDEEHLTFASMNNPDTNFNITVPVGVCFGFVTADALSLVESGIDFSIRSNTISLCVDSSTTFSTNNYELNGNAENMQVNGDQTFYTQYEVETAREFMVYLNSHRVQITSADRHFQVNFLRPDASQQVFPWVKCSQKGQQAQATLYGIGKIDGLEGRPVTECNQEFIPICTQCMIDGVCQVCPPPPRHECENSFYVANLTEQVWYKPSNFQDLGLAAGSNFVELSGPNDAEYETYTSPSLKNADGNYEILLNNNYAGGSICFGYVLSSETQEVNSNAGGSYAQRSLSVCTNGTVNNVWNPQNTQSECRGRLQTNQGSMYKVLVGFNSVQITSYPQKEYQCNFTMPASFRQEQTLLPWVQIQKPAQSSNSASVQFIGSGRPQNYMIECEMGLNYIPFTCNSQFQDPNIADNYWYKSSDRSQVEYNILQTGNWISEGNTNGNYNVTLNREAQGQICFGYLPKIQVNNFYLSQDDQELWRSSISICIDGKNTTQNNVEGQVSCQGDINQASDFSYTVRVLAETVQITSSNQHYQCSFSKNAENDNLLAYIWTQSTDEVTTKFTGLGKPDENAEQCLTPYIPQDPIYVTCANSFYNISKVSESWVSAEDENQIISTGQLSGPGQYLSFDNVYGNYIVEFNNQDQTDESFVCFGYVQKDQVANIFSDPTVSPMSYMVAFCTNGISYNYQDSVMDLNQNGCQGNITEVNKLTGVYNVTVRRNNVQITADNHHLQCNLRSTVDDKLVPYIYLSAGQSVRVRLFGEGRPEQNEPECNRGYIALPIPIPPIPRTCDNFYSFENYNLVDSWQSGEDSLSEGRLFNNDPEGREFVSPNDNANYKFTIDEFTGVVCFGYVEKKFQATEDVSTSICFDSNSETANEYYTHARQGPDTIFCNGNFSYHTGNSFNVTVQANQVQITETARRFQCNFTNTAASTFQPYVKIGEQANIQYSLLSYGKMDCPEPFEPLPPIKPPLYYCDQSAQSNQWKQVNPEGSAVRQTNTLTNDISTSHSEFYSDDSGNNLASFTVTLGTTYSGDKVCFGYINQKDIFELSNKPELYYSENALAAVCTDGTHYPSSGSCLGSMNTQSGETFQVHIGSDSVTISSTSVADQFQCAFSKDYSNEIQYVPWAEIYGLQSVEVQYTGCEPVITRDCRDFVDASQTVPEWYDAQTNITHTQVLTSTTLNSFGSLLNLNGNYIIAFQNTPISGSVCFGYTSQDDWKTNDPQGDNTPKSASVCFINGGSQQYNAYGESSCWGKPKLEAGQKFYVTVLDNQTQITQFPDRHFQCNFNVAQQLDLVPFVQLNEDNAVTTKWTGIGKLWCPTNYIAPTPTPPPIPSCLESPWNGQYTGQNTFSTVTGQSISNYIQQYEGRDKGFTVVLNQDITEGRICFGFVSETQKTEVTTDQQYDLQGAYAVCTDQPAGPSNGQCAGLLETTLGSTFLVYKNLNGKLTIQQDSQETGFTIFQCYFDSQETVYPWVKLSETTATVTAEMTCTTYEPNVPHYIPTCQERKWQSNVIPYIGSTSDLSLVAGTGQFVQPQNMNQNYTVTLTETLGDTFVCIGYVPFSSYSTPGTEIQLNSTLTFCTNNVKYNPNDEAEDSIKCKGTPNIQKDKEFLVYVNQEKNKVTIKQGKFRCDLSGQFTDYVPFVYLQEVTSLKAVLSCTEFPLTPIPDPRTCDKDFFDETQLIDRQWYSAGEPGQSSDISYGDLANQGGQNKDYVSKNNIDANFDVTLTTVALKGKVCFGYIYEGDVISLEAGNLPIQVVGMCTDGTFINYESLRLDIIDNNVNAETRDGSLQAETVCQGNVQYDAGTVYHVYNNENSIQITANNHHYQCNFPIQRLDKLVPWVSMSDGQQNVNAYLRGIGRLSGPNCELPYVPLICPSTWTTSSTGGSVTQQGTEEIQNILQGTDGAVSNFVSTDNMDNQFTVTLNQDVDLNPSQLICFGYIPHSLLRDMKSKSNEEVQATSAISFCTDGTKFNYYGGDLNVLCKGQFTVKTSKSFYVQINQTSEEVDIGNMGSFLNCRYTRNTTEQLVPWVSVAGNQQVSVANTCSDQTRINKTPTPPPPPPPPKCSQIWNNRQIVQQDWYGAFSYQKTFTFDNYIVSQSIETVHFVADDSTNNNANYEINLQENYNTNSKVCFGYISSQTRQSIPSSPYEDLAHQAVSICTDGTLNNPFGFGSDKITCNNQFNSTWPSFNEGTLYKVVNYADQVQIWTKNGEVNCNFTLSTVERETLIPWVQTTGLRSVVVELTGRGGLEENPCEYIPVYKCIEPEPSACAVLFSQCNFSGVQFNMCDAHGHQDLPADQQGAVLSMYLPPGSRVNLGCVDDGQINCGAQSLEFGESQPCLDHEEVFHRHIKSAEFIQLNKPQTRQAKKYLTKNRR